MILPSEAHEILRCCPGVENVTCTKASGSQIANALCAVKAKNLVSLHSVPLTDATAKRR